MDSGTPCEPDEPLSDLLQSSVRHQRVLSRFGAYALVETELEALLQKAAQCLAEGLELPRAKVLRYRAETNDLLVVAGVGWHDGVVGQAVMPNDPDTPPGRALATRAPVVSEDLRRPGTLKPGHVLAEHGVVAMLNAPIGTDYVPWGVLEADGSAPCEFHETDVLFVQSFAHLLAAAIRRAEAEASARLSRVQLDAVLDQLPVAVSVAEAPSGRMVVYNEKGVELLGHPMLVIENIAGYTLYGGIHWDGTPYRAEEYPMVRAVLYGENIEQEPMLYRRGDGRLSHLLVTAAPVRDAAGKILLGVTVAQNIDDRVRIETELRETRDRLFRVLESTTDCVLVIGRDWRILYMNERAQALVGEGRDLIGTPFWEAYPGREGSIFWQRYHKAMDTGKPDAFEAFEEIMGLWLEVHAYPSVDGMTLFFRDVSERRRQQQALADSEARYRAAFEQVAIGIAEVDRDGRLTRANDRYCAIVGYPRDELLRLRFQDITHPDDLPTGIALTEQLYTGALTTFVQEKRYIRNDGSTVWASLSGSAVRDTEGRPVYMLAVIEDISARKQAEAEREELLHRQDLLMREMNHRIKNSLQMVALLVHMQAVDIADPDTRARFEETATRIATVALVHRRLYSASGPESVESAPYLRDLCDDIGSALGLNGLLTVDAVDVVLPADTAIALGLMVNELVTNAAKYAYPMGGAGPVRVTLDHTEGGHLRLSVSDEGVGLPPGFDPTASTGLGMRVLVVLVDKVEADLLIADRGIGTCFQVVLRG